MRQKGSVCCKRLCGMPSHATPQLASGMSGCVTISLLIHALAIETVSSPLACACATCSDCLATCEALEEPVNRAWSACAHVAGLLCRKKPS